jgi:pimeloyl-ACP methyl ester carboxylesterase
LDVVCVSQRAWPALAWTIFLTTALGLGALIGAFVGPLWLAVTLEVLFAPTCFIIADNFVGWLRGRSAVAMLSWEEADPQGENAFEFVYLPGVNNSATFTLQPYLGLLRLYGGVWKMDYPLYGLNHRTMRQRLLNVLDRASKPVVFIGQSYGAMECLQLMREYWYGGKVAGFIALSAPHSWRDVKWPVPPWLFYLLRGGPLTELVWPQIMRWQDAQGPQGSLPYGDDEKLYRQHHDYCLDHPLSGTTAQNRALMRLEGGYPGEFSSVPALLIYTENDVLVNNASARVKQREVFDPRATRIAYVPGLHANLVEYAAEHRQLIGPWLSDLLANRRSAPKA